jgi:hypothetical protein
MAKHRSFFVARKHTSYTSECADSAECPRSTINIGCSEFHANSVKHAPSPNLMPIAKRSFGRSANVSVSQTAQERTSRPLYLLMMQSGGFQIGRARTFVALQGARKDISRRRTAKFGRRSLQCPVPGGRPLHRPQLVVGDHRARPCS